MDAMEFFQRSAGRWRSQRATHHLPFRRAEIGDSEIIVETLEADDPKVAEICQLHQIDPSKAVGGAFVQWQGSMAWDKENENHSGSTVFAIVPDPDNPKRGQMLRERGYAEIVPVAGRYLIDEEGGLVLITEYETMSSVERFWFANPNLRMRTSTVKRFGGFSTASFCTESRILSEPESSKSVDLPAKQNKADAKSFYSVLGW
ncbi:MAG: phycobiliprotein lyase [Oscillatoriaceae bacterium SKW80]|nr:phycobiliprotein lyase [Oscillatoriaceae bacterium SKYG93]MCX8121576.1 phycobiliprotein lyase [Oscillatoriaceae bacterium SKW80]MDW8452837.1 phycobiliprotein lyase [Oscillatoriaceae cyanobacterium SKYGB_i_bin93]HIK27921.1 phycobiliprotein lyase [Oscillatoriaceae cyanobacterium M7585_C2015_266]